MSQQKLPDFVEEKILAILQKSPGISREALITEFQQIFADPVVSSDTQFSSVEARQKYATAVLWARYVSRPPVKEVDVIPCGFDSLRKTKSQKLMSSLYVLVKDGDKNSLKRISLMGASAIATLYRNVNILSINGGYRYRVKLGSFGGQDDGDYVADQRTYFTNPVHVAQLTPEVFRKILNIPLLTIAQLVEYPSKVRSDGYLVNTDWRCVRAIITDELRGTRKDSDLEWGNYKIADETTPAEPHVTSDGRNVSPALTVWCPVELMVFERESECEFYGTVSIDRDGIPSMNACLVIPVYARRKEESKGEKQ